MSAPTLRGHPHISANRTLHIRVIPRVMRSPVFPLVGNLWEIALSLLETGEEAVRMGALTLYRDAAGPAHDGLIHVEVDCPNEPDLVTEEMAGAAMARAVA